MRDHKVEQVRVDMGAPEVIPERVPCDPSLLQRNKEASEPVVGEDFVIHGRTYPHYMRFYGQSSLCYVY